MLKELHSAALGMMNTQTRLEVTANNIANASTVGFKRAGVFERNLVDAKSGLFNNPAKLEQEDSPIGSCIEWHTGGYNNTTNPLDLAIDGSGFFVLQLPDNHTAYTRDGTFQLNRDGEITTSHGYRLNPNITIPDDVVEIQISRNGTVSILREFSTETVGQIELARFVNPGGLRNLGENMYIESPASGAAMYEEPGTNNTGEILQKYLETSNVSVVEEMVNMITAQRAYELNSKSVQTADNILGNAVNLKRQ